jgi:hypothetical protein
VATRPRERRLKLARRISVLAGAAVAEVLRDLDYLAQPTAALPATRALLAGTPTPASTPAPAVTAPNNYPPRSRF